MVAETHSHRDRIDPDDIIALLAADSDSEEPVDLTLADCGFDGDLGLFDLVALLAEEYGERTLAPVSVDDLDSEMTLAQLIELLEFGDPD